MIENHLGEETTKNLPEKVNPQETVIIEDPSGKQMIEIILEEETIMNPLKEVDQGKVLLGDVAVTVTTEEVVKEVNIN